MFGMTLTILERADKIVLVKASTDHPHPCSMGNPAYFKAIIDLESNVVEPIITDIEERIDMVRKVRWSVHAAFTTPTDEECAEMIVLASHGGWEGE